MLWDLSVAIPNPSPWTCTTTMMREWFEVVFRVVILYGIYTFNRCGYLIFQEWHDVLCSIIGKCLCWCSLTIWTTYAMSSTTTLANLAEPARPTGALMHSTMSDSCLLEVNHDLPNLVVPSDSQSEKVSHICIRSWLYWQKELCD